MSDPLARPAVLDDAEAIAVVHHTSWMQTYPGLLPAKHWESDTVERRAQVTRGVSVIGKEDVARVRNARGRPVAALMMLAVALIMASQFDALARFATAIWIASFAVICVAFVLALGQWRATRK